MEASGKFLPENAAEVLCLLQSCEERGVEPRFHLSYFGKPEAVHFALTITDGGKPARLFLSGTAKSRTAAR